MQQIKFEIKNNKLDQLQGMSAKMAANGIRTHARTTTNQWEAAEELKKELHEIQELQIFDSDILLPCQKKFHSKLDGT